MDLNMTIDRILALKKLISNMHSGDGKLYFPNFEYRPLPGLLKSGIPAAINK
jgi:hypothetical protein